MRGGLPGAFCKQPDLQHQRSAGEVCGHTGCVQHSAAYQPHGATGWMCGTGGRGAWAALTDGPDIQTRCARHARAATFPGLHACVQP